MRHLSVTCLILGIELISLHLRGASQLLFCILSAAVTVDVDYWQLYPCCYSIFASYRVLPSGLLNIVSKRDIFLFSAYEPRLKGSGVLSIYGP